jgi:uncharacterized tellurite resistance protein B-like protein
MRTITYHDVQYRREQQLYKSLQPVLERLKTTGSLAQKVQRFEMEFFQLLGHALKIDTLPEMTKLLGHLNGSLKICLKVHLFLLQSPICHAASMPRYGIQSKRDGDEIIVMVSQHFLNELDSAEQLSILGHELAHLLFGHIDVPAKIILKMDTSLGRDQRLKSDVLKWLTCAEVSCDAIGYLSCGRDVDAFSRAMLKYSTGLYSNTMQKGDLFQHLYRITFQQFDDIYLSMFDPILTTHPLTPLRLKIINCLGKADLINNFGKDLPDETIEDYKRHFNTVIDAEVSKIYPEIIPLQKPMENEMLFNLCVAVALSDGQVTMDEMHAIGRILGTNGSMTKRFENLGTKLKAATASSVTAAIVETAVRQAKEKNYLKPDIVKLLRPMLSIAASDRRIEATELDTIYNFAKNFGITKAEIMVLIGQMGLV